MKHYYKAMVGEFDSKEELDCAKALEMSPRVKRWMRNVRGMSCLPTSSGKSYPDFVGELDDGRSLIVEIDEAFSIGDQRLLVFVEES